MDKLAVSPEIDAQKRAVLIDRNSLIHSDVLFSQGKKIIIQHQGEHYHLRLTRNDKLILTK